MAALLPQTASAHALLLQSDPSPGAVLTLPPAAVTLIFTEPVTPAGAGIKVYSPSGRQVAAPSISTGSALSATLRATENGSYVVTWQVIAQDTHPSRGTFGFSVGVPSGNPYSQLLNDGDIGTATPAGLVLQALARWVHFAGFALAFGVTAYLALIRRVLTSPRLVALGVILLVVAEPLALVAQLASLSFDGDTVIALLGSNFGRLLGLRLAAAVMAWTLMPTRNSSGLLAIGALVALLDGASAHSIPSLLLAGQLLASVHVAAMGLWVGGLVAYVRWPDPRFAHYALWTLAGTVGTGALLAFAHTGFAASVLATDYGVALIVKVLVVAATLMMVLLRRRRLELGLMAVAIVVATALAALPPPR